jgi:hypothetical protein
MTRRRYPQALRPEVIDTMSQPEFKHRGSFSEREQVLPLLRERMENIRNWPAVWELLFVSDGSTDGSTKFIEAWAQTAPSVKLVALMRNFGHQSATSPASHSHRKLRRNYGRGFAGRTTGSPGNVSDIVDGESRCGFPAKSTTSE